MRSDGIHLFIYIFIPLHLILHSITQQICVKHLLCVGACATHRGYNSEQARLGLSFMELGV